MAEMIEESKTPIYNTITKMISFVATGKSLS